jgi:hypothetical protein
MKDLIDFLNESILDDVDVQMADGDTWVEHEDIIKFIEDNYILDGLYGIHENIRYALSISKKPDSDGKYLVNVNGNKIELLLSNKNAVALTNGKFKWNKIPGPFYAVGCKKLKSLEGIGKASSYELMNCVSLESVEGLPEKTTGSVSLYGCTGLKTLKGAPKIVGAGFNINNCKNLNSLEYFPKIVKGTVYAKYCGGCFTEEAIRKVCDAKKKIYADK